MLIAHQIPTTVHGHYLIREAERDGGGLLVGFHGYAENAERHLRALESIPGAARWTLCAVQGLSVFYNSRRQEISASWMTRHNRELAIQDNIAYIDAVVEQLRQGETPQRRGPLVFAGFSQGVAMAYRAAALGKHPCAGVISLAGDVPPELVEVDLSPIPHVLLGRGKKDDWYTASMLQTDVQLLQEKGVATETCLFDGGHLWTADFYEACGRFLSWLEG
jgi:predicted esterase